VKKYPDYFNAEVQELLKEDKDVFSFKGLQYLDSVEDSMALNNSMEPCVIISSSGMAEAGRVRHHIAHTVEDARNTILMTGYCEPRSLGGRLKTLPDEVGIFGKRFAVRAQIAEITSLSAHGDYEDLHVLRNYFLYMANTMCSNTSVKNCCARVLQMYIYLPFMKKSDWGLINEIKRNDEHKRFHPGWFKTGNGIFRRTKIKMERTGIPY
jgi:hypothetical protein